MFSFCFYLLALLLLLPWRLVSLPSSASDDKLSIVFVYLLVNTNCEEVHIPLYIWSTLNQTVNYQTPDCEVYFITDISHCSHTRSAATLFGTRLRLIDLDTIITPKTKQFRIGMHRALSSADGNLYTTSALRFFVLEDFMIYFKVPFALHVESDNLLFGPMRKILPSLRQYYPALAATPLARNQHTMTACVLWINNLSFVSHFNAFLMNYTSPNSTQFAELHSWAAMHHEYKCRILTEDRCLYLNGTGIKRYFFNEMTFLAHYQRTQPGRLLNLPLLPHIAVSDEAQEWGVAEFGMGGQLVNGDTFGGVWDVAG